MKFDTYDEYLLNNSDLIIIDTSTMMNTEAMKQFIDREAPLFEKYGAKIVVPNVVLGELHKHRLSGIDDKRAKAEAALQMLSENDSLFSFDETFNPETIQPFADPELLAFLIVNRSSFSQLIITNDRRLGEDAIALNGQSSNRGNRIMACYISKEGFLSRARKREESIISSNTVDTKTDNSVNGNASDKRHNWSDVIVATLSGVIGGMAIDRYLIPCVVKGFKALA